MQITRYDETLVDNRSVNLTNLLDTIDIDVPVGFSIPNGSFRLWEQTPITFTHFTANVPSFGGDTVFVITNLVCINSEVTEYYYSIDYLKDYWNRYSNNNILPLPQTLLVSETSDRTDNIIPVNTGITSIAYNTIEQLGDSLNVSRPYLVTKCAIGGSMDPTLTARYAMLNGSNEAISTKGIYYFTTSNILPFFFEQYLAVSPRTGQDFSDLYGNIENSFYAPVVLAGSGATTTQTDDIYYVSDSGSHDKMTVTGQLSGQTYAVSLPLNNSLIVNDKGTGISITVNNANDLPPYKKYKLYIPYIGWYDVPLSEIYTTPTLFGQSLELCVRYYFDLINGLVAARFGVKIDSTNILWSSFQTPFVSLPTITIPTSNYATSAIANQNNKDVNTLSTIISSLGALTPAFVTGNPVTAIPGAAVNLFSKAVQNHAIYEQNQANAHLGTFTSGNDNAIGQIDRQFKLRITTMYSTLTYAQAKELYGFPLNEYTDTVTIPISGKSWIDTSNSILKGLFE